MCHGRIICIFVTQKNQNMTLNDIRKKSGLLIIVIGVAMLGFILTDLMNSGSSLFQKGQNTLLKIDDKKIMFTNFEMELENNINMKFMSSLGTVNISEEQRQNERDLLFDKTVENILLEEKLNQSGVNVGDKESWDLISGEYTGNQSNLFGFFFREQTESGDWNQYSPDLIKNWIQMGSDNAQWPRYRFFKENEIRDKKMKKYISCVSSGLYATNDNAENYYINQTKSSSGRYVLVSSNSSDLDYDPSNKEINDYYKSNIEDFVNVPVRSITYFTFPLDPSEDDKNSILTELKNLISDRKIFNKRTNEQEVELGFKNTNDIESFISMYADNEYKVNNFTTDEFNEIFVNKTVNENIIQPYFDMSSCKMARVIERTKDSVAVVYFERELFASDETLNETYSEVFDFINNNPKINDIERVSEEIKLRPRTVSFEKMDKSVPGLGTSREIVKWAFDNSTILNETKFFDLQDKYIVAFLSDISEDKYNPLKDVQSQIIKILKKRFTSNKIAQEISSLNISSIEELANLYKTDVKKISNLKFGSDSFGDIGYNPKLVGNFFNLKLNNISEPIVFERGVILFVKDKEGEVGSPSSFSSYKNIIEKDYQSKINQSLFESIKDNKDITDNRFNFY